MDNWIDLINYGIAVAGLMVVLMGLIMSIFSRYQEEWDRKFFIILFSFLIAYVSFDLLSQFSLTMLGEPAAMLSRIAVFGESFFSSLLMPMLTIFQLHCTGEDCRRSKLLAAVNVLWLIYFVLLVVTQFTTVIYVITPDNIYQRGPWYPVLLIVPVLMMLLNILGLWHRRSRLSKQQAQALAAYLLIPMGCMIVQMFSYGLLMIVIGSCIASFCMFIFILREQQDRYVAQQEENARQKASIMVLEMRPHYIYNTLTSIYSLCNQDPKRARQVIMDFTTYLRRNFTAIASEAPVPFSTELEHTRAYLAVEQAQYEDSLFVDYDTPHTTFRIPPLTLQPIVENAVKHGRDPYAGPFHISIRTRRTDSGSEIVVTDNGCGFAPADGNEPHIALKNIRQRLDLMCGGSLNISPGEEGGTVVTILSLTIQQKNVLLNRPHFNLFDAFLKAYLISPSILSKKFDILEHPLEGRLENR